MYHLPEYHHNLSLRLSEVLDDIGVNERMVIKWRRAALLRETLNTVALGHPVYSFGSLSEGTTTLGLKSDADTLYSGSTYNVIQDYSEWKHGCRNLLMIQDDSTSPGYCHLQMIRRDIPLPHTDILDKHCFRDADSRILLKNTYIKDTTGGVYHGPAMTREATPCTRDSDAVYAFPCNSWPYEARDWSARCSGRWPTADMKRYAENSGCLLVPVESKVSQMDQLEWRISTSKAERCLMFNLNISQLRCYVLLKMILKTYLSLPISSFMCKTALLHCIENSHPSLWQENNLITCLSSCLQQLYSFLLNKNCPHFIIPRNNLMAGQFLPGVIGKLQSSMRYVMKSHERALLGVRLDDLGQRLQIKMNVMYQGVQNVHICPSADNSLIIAMLLTINVAMCINFNIEEILKTTGHRRNYKTMFQHLLQTIFNLTHYREGTHLENTAVSLLTPPLCSIAGSVLASFNIGTNNSVPPEALSLLSLGLNSDVSSGRLKMASVFYCAGDLLRTDFVLRETERLYCLDTVRPICSCYNFDIQGDERAFKIVCYNQNEKAIKSVLAFCIRFIQAEIHCIPHELQYELYRSAEDYLLHRDAEDDWMDFAVVDSLPFLYFLQYKTYGYLHRYNDQQRALTNLVTTISSERNLGHRETALNLLGQCMEQENRPNDALSCYKTSLNVRARNNVAIIHICRMLANMINAVP